MTFQTNTLKYDYDVDWDHDSKLKINVDMTIATKYQSFVFSNRF